MSKPQSRSERMRTIMAEATARDRAQRAEAEARRAKGTAGLPPLTAKVRGNGSVANGRSGYRTAGRQR